MKTRNYLSSLALMATVALSGCTNDSDTPDNKPNFPQDGVMRFATSVTDAQTRTGYDDSNVTTQNLYLWVTPTKAGYTYKSIILHHTDGGWGTYSSLGSNGSYTSITLLWQDKTTPVEVVASSFGGNVTNRVDLPTEANISVYSSQTVDRDLMGSDFLYFSGTVNPTLTADETANGSTSQYALVDGKVRLPLRHINSKLNIMLTLGTEFNASADGLGMGTANPLTDVKVNNVYGERQFNMTTGEFGEYKDWQNNAVSLSSITLSEGATTLGTWSPAANKASKATASYECILIPQTVDADKFSITFTLGGKAYKWTSTDAVTFESGKVHILPLKVGKDLTISQAGDITTKAWVPGTPDNNGNIETE